MSKSLKSSNEMEQGHYHAWLLYRLEREILYYLYYLISSSHQASDLSHHSSCDWTFEFLLLTLYRMMGMEEAIT